MPIGGIGTGTISLGGRGNLQDWEIMNRPAKGYNPGEGANAPSFVLYIERPGNSVVRLLEGPVPLSSYEGPSGVKEIANHGWPRFQNAAFSAAYPFAQVHLTDQSLPVSATIKAYNPLLPNDGENSELPIACLRFEIRNNTPDSLTIAIAGAMQNFIGEDGSKGKALNNKNSWYRSSRLQGIVMSSAGVDSAAEQWGTMALLTDSQDLVTGRTNWKRFSWGSAQLDYYDDLLADGELSDRPESGEAKPMASLAIKKILAPGEMGVIPFYICWHFPNRFAWSSTCVGNHYTTRFRNASDVAEKIIPHLPELEAQTLEFVNAFLAAEIPEVLKEAALFNLSTLRSQTCFRTRDGRYFAWEGCGDKEGCCWGSCTHVWNYEQAIAFLYGRIARSLRMTEFASSTDSTGLMSFRVHLPLEKKPWGKAAADGQMGCIMKMYRDWQLSGDDKFLKQLWPNVRKSLEFCWINGGWDADRNGVMEGCQHNTMDVEYYGPNPQMQIWYLGALRAAEEMARYLDDTSFAEQCAGLFQQGSAWADRHLYNGQYYIQQIMPPMDESRVAPALLVGMGAKDLTNPDYQLGEGCLVDQLVGQCMAHVCDLGYLVQPAHAAATLQSIMKYNYRSTLSDHFNCMRSFALGDEAALLMASYPEKRPANPFPYFTEVMTGFEYTAAIGMLYENQIENGLLCIRNIRNRYDGLKRNPFDEAECGHHYGRAMISWAGILAWTGFHYSAVQQSIAFAAKEGTFFWSTGWAYGTVAIKRLGADHQITITVLKGEMACKKISMTDHGSVQLKKAQTLSPGSAKTYIIRG